jgi:hypothetical protein
VWDGGLYKLLVDHVKNVHGSEKLRNPSNFEKDYEKNEWWDFVTEKFNSNLKNGVWEIALIFARKSMIDSRWLYKIKHVFNGRIEEYRDKVVGLSHKEELALLRLVLQWP